MMRFSFLFISLLNIILFSSGTSAQAFSLLSPADDATTSCSLILDWEDVSSPDASLKYTLFISKNDHEFNDPICIENLDYSIHLMTPDDGIEDSSNYYWKVWAVNDYGEIRESDIRRFHTDSFLN
jgi:hypothetical protein